MLTFRKGINKLFTINNFEINLYTISMYSVEYTVEKEGKSCRELNCKDICACNLCLCCSVCTENCDCPVSINEPNGKMSNLLGFGDENYRFDLIILAPSWNIILPPNPHPFKKWQNSISPQGSKIWIVTAQPNLNLT